MRELDSRMPLAKDKRCARRNDDRQRGQRSLVAQRSGKMTGVVLAFDGPTKSEATVGKPGKRKLEKTIDALPPGFEIGRRQRSARRDKTLALGPAPGFEVWGK